MLFEIQSSAISQKVIRFDEGLNVILGDSKSTNSIGKSTSLLIIDFAMGGDSYPKLASTMIEAIGHHSIGFSFNFDGEIYRFVRFTKEADVIYEANSEYITGSSMSNHKFTDWLKSKYGLSHLPGTWRSLAGLYSRIWGKKNDDVDKPLKGYDADTDDNAISQLIKLFNFYDRIESAKIELKNAQETKNALNLAFSKNLIKKLTKKEYEANRLVIDRLDKEIEEVKENLLKFTVNLEEIYSRELIELKEEKRIILEEKYLLINQRKRLELSLSDKLRVDNRQFDRLNLFFENANIDKLKDIEAFHVKLSVILRKQIEESINEISQKTIEVESRQAIVDQKIDKLLEGVNSPKIIVERMLDLSNRSIQLKRENSFFDNNKETLMEVKEVKKSMVLVMEEILDSIEKLINSHIKELNKNIYSEGRKTPTIHLFPTTYKFDHAGNSGTGKSFIDLILFDLTVLELSLLPFIIHDSFLFKNIEDSSVSNIFNRYDTAKKQVFVSIDGIEKYSLVAQKIIQENTRMELADNNLLFGKDMR